MKTISIIIPAYNEQDNITRCYEAISDVMNIPDINYEVIFIDDGSKDLTYDRVVQLSVKYPNVRGISFSRNFGKESAIFAGLEAATGDAAIVMDSDLQHPPTLIPQMISKWSEGYEVVEAVKASRGREGIFHKISAKLFYSMISKATNIDMTNASDYKLIDRKAIDALLLMPERTPFFRALSSWVGFNSITLPFEVQEREVGKSKWSTWSLTKYAIRNITSFSGSPLQLVTIMGWLLFLFGIGVAIEALYQYFNGTAATGFTTVILLQLITSGGIMISLGIIGLYISKIYDEIKARPKYIISKTCSSKEDK